MTTNNVGSEQKLWASKLGGATLALHPREVAVMMAAHDRFNPKSDLPGFGKHLLGNSIKIGPHMVTASGFRLAGEPGVRLERVLNAFSGKPVREYWWVPFFAFDTASTLERYAVKING